MSRLRAILGLLGIAGIAAALVLAFLQIPAAGHYRGPYGDVVAAAAVPLRHVTDVVAAVNFDFRALDTLGEECILFVSVLGVAVLLRQSEDSAAGRSEEQDHCAGRPAPRSSDAVRSLGVGVAGATALFGFCVVTHGALTPGGGFQGGVVLATAPLLVYLCSSPEVFVRIAPRPLVEAGESAGVFLFLVVAVTGLLAGHELLRNVVPLGPHGGELLSGGIIPILNVCTGLEVAGGFVLLMLAFLDETLRRRGLR